MLNNKFRCILAGIIGIFGISLLAMEPSLAQVAQTSDAAKDSSDALETIVVTAQKREQNGNDVGESIITVSGKTLRDRQIESVADFAAAIPGLSYAESQRNTPIFTLRGVGYNDSALSAAPAVSVYIDQLPLPFPALASHSEFDLERVEVLKGPQGTLFGENSTGGAINYIAAKPTRDFESGASVDYGRFGQNDDEGYLSGPLTDTLTGRVAARIERSDGWQQSNSRPGDENGALKDYMARALLDFQPTDGVKFELHLSGSRDLGEPQAPQFIGAYPINESFPVPAISPAFLSPANDRAADWTPGLPRSDVSLYHAALTGDILVRDELTLTSLTSYINYAQRNAEDLDGLPGETTDNGQDIGSIKSVVQELRLDNGTRSRFRWVVGGNFEHDTVDQAVDVVFPDSPTTAQLGSIGYPAVAQSDVENQDITTWAAFAHSEFDFTPTLTVLAGARYTSVDNKANICASDPTPPYYLGQYFYNVLAAGRAGPYKAGDCTAIDDIPNNGLSDPPGAGLPGRFISALNEDNVSWRGEIDWKPYEHTLFYGSVSKGYKQGGFLGQSTSTFKQLLPVTQESVEAYETGFKTTLAERRIQINGAAFYYDYRNKQLEAEIFDPAFGILPTLTNVPKSSIKGAELSVDVLIVRGLRASVDTTYLDTKIEQYVGINESGVATDFSGDRLPFAPKFEVAGNVDYDFPLGNGLTGFVGAGVRYQTSTVAQIGGNSPVIQAYGETSTPLAISPYALTDIRGGIESSDGKWKLSLYGKNIFDKFYSTNVVSLTNSISRYAGFPATYGVMASVRFH
jgi:iron complex outermembrane recepter protein